MPSPPLPEDPLFLKRPPQRWLDGFRIRDIGNDTVGSYVEHRFSLCIFCVECPRVTEWAPAELANRFGNRPCLRVADIASRLKCACGSDRIAVGPRYNPLTPEERQGRSAGVESDHQTEGA